MHKVNINGIDYAYSDGGKGAVIEEERLSSNYFGNTTSVWVGS